MAKTDPSKDRVIRNRDVGELVHNTSTLDPATKSYFNSPGNSNVSGQQTKKQKGKTKAQLKREVKASERRKKEFLAIFVPEQIKTMVQELAGELGLPSAQIGTLAIMLFVTDPTTAKEKLEHFKTKSNIPLTEYMLDLEKCKNELQGATLNKNKNIL